MLKIHVMRPYLENCIQLPSVRKTWSFCSAISEGPQGWLRTGMIHHMEKGWESWDCSFQRTEGLVEILSVCIISWWKSAWKTETDYGPGDLQRFLPTCDCESCDWSLARHTKHSRLPSPTDIIGLPAHTSYKCKWQ